MGWRRIVIVGFPDFRQNYSTQLWKGMRGGAKAVGGKFELVSGRRAHAFQLSGGSGGLPRVDAAELWKTWACECDKRRYI